MIAANARRDFLHKTSLDIAKNHGIVAIEKLQVRNMSRSAKGTAKAPGRNVGVKKDLNRSILDKGWGTFAALLRYKLEYRGGELIEVPAAYTSLTCAECGVLPTRKIGLAQWRHSPPKLVPVSDRHCGSIHRPDGCAPP